MWNLIFFHLNIVLVLGKIGVWFALDVQLAQKSFWTHLMVSLGDGAQVEAHFGPFIDSANLNARWVHGLRRTYHRLKNHFGRT
jgi:hypothetical protein